MAFEYRHTPEDDTDNQCSDCLGNVIKGNTADRCARICLLSLSDAHSPTVAPDSFKFAVLDALKISDRPIEFLLDREEPPPPTIRLQEELRLARPAPRIKVLPSRTSKATFCSFVQPTSLQLAM